jgi:hypothetical protein
MNPLYVALAVLGALILAIWIGHLFRRQLPDRRLNEETKDTVKLTIGLIGTMAALLLGLLVSSAKASYDAERTQVTQMTAKIVFLNRVLNLYGPETRDTRRQLHVSIEDAIERLWPKSKGRAVDITPNIEAGDSVYFSIQALSPANETQQKLKTIAETTVAELAQLRALLIAQAESSISAPLLVVVISWLFIIFASFSLLAPPNKTATVALFISSLAVGGAIFLLLELDGPFEGLIRIPNREMAKAMDQITN